MNRVLRVGTLSSFKLTSDSGKKLDFFSIPSVNQILSVESNLLKFEFLNLRKTFPFDSIDWNDQSHGKLWNYNLQYLDYLKQEDISLEVKITLVKDLYSWLWNGKLPLEPYPVSLRVMNMIRFLNSDQLSEDDLAFLRSYIFAEVNYLSQNLEYHILANHLLENAFALWMGATYFGEKGWLIKAEKLLRSELKEQILPDGAHYELAPMYHQIILYRVMEAYYLTSEDHSLKSFLKQTGNLMLGWLAQMSFANGTLPHFNDTTEDIALPPSELLELGESIGLVPEFRELKDSGYRILQSADLKLVADVEGIKPSYQPGHAHADTFSFVLHQGSIPVIVDPGISTYNISKRRNWERSTVAHNTLTIDRQNSSQVWSGFRVGRRAKVKMLADGENFYSAQHDGFGKQIHNRIFEMTETGFRITDKVRNRRSEALLEVRFYLHPDVQVRMVDDLCVKLNNQISLAFKGASKIGLEDYEFCLGYNRLKQSKVLLVNIHEDQLVTLITTNQ
ncbi:hypothetical protein GCM10009119_43240 [Algoriphagus jejuensis]|uniref:Heparinase II/III-like protein n=2 Tax=Algoriphagus jejuensis TaxID=419934 RepID=A0ABN1N6P0_9BACT